ncbi:MAG: nucleotidyltransferase domain-containing protein [Spirochaetales bacterium]|nr:nucleotidyltransferase domain-containing protein [Spirochaetales bacterium]
MRISERQHTIIKDSVREAFGSHSRVLLFGSRVDDNRKGGDIDLLVCSTLSGVHAAESKIKALTRMMRFMGDRKIDLITTSMDEQDERVVVREALEKGIEL